MLWDLNWKMVNKYGSYYDDAIYTLDQTSKEVIVLSKREKDILRLVGEGRSSQEIADILSNNNEWKSHGRPINIETLENKLRLRIEDYSNNDDLRNLLRQYYDLLSDYVKSHKMPIFVQTKSFI